MVGCSFFKCRETLTSEPLSQYLAENFVFWVGEVDLEKELEFQSLFGYPIQFPFLAVVGYIDNKMTIINLYQGRILHFYVLFCVYMK
jgi:hypothetical protein